MRRVRLHGFEMYAVEDAPTDHWLCACWPDKVIAVAFKDATGQWWRGKGGVPEMAKTEQAPIGWVSIEIALKRQR